MRLTPRMKRPEGWPDTEFDLAKAHAVPVSLIQSWARKIRFVELERKAQQPYNSAELLLEVRDRSFKRIVEELDAPGRKANAGVLAACMRAVGAIESKGGASISITNVNAGGHPLLSDADVRELAEQVMRQAPRILARDIPLLKEESVAEEA